MFQLFSIINLQCNELKRDYEIKKKEETRLKNRIDKTKEITIDIIFCLYYGIGRVRDEEKAKKLCLNESLKDNLIVKGIKYYNGWDVDRDFKKSFNSFKKFYEENEDNKRKDKEKGYCLNMIAYFYKEGKGVKKDINKAINFYLKAIELGNSMAMNNMAFLHKSGKGMKKDVNRAIELYEKAIEHGNIFAMYNLAHLYEQGEETEKDLKKAIKLYEKSIDLGNKYSMYNLAMIYQESKGEIQDYEKSANYFLKLNRLNDENQSMFKFKLIDLLSFSNLEWSTDYHPFWLPSSFLNNQIITLLLISKHRNISSVVHFDKIFVRGIIMIVIKYVCNLFQNKN